MQERLQKILSQYGVASRRGAEQIISAGRVKVNGQVAALGSSADPAQDQILVDGKPLQQMQQRLYIMLNKPRGFVCTLSDPQGRKTVAELVADCGQRVYPVGRLDQYSEGLLLFTNDGDWANALTHPSHEIDKVYLVWVNGWHPGALEILTSALDIDGRPIRPARVRCIKEQAVGTLLQITIHEGRNRQIRKMCEQAELTVTRLRRVAEGPLRLGELPTGKWRTLTEEELRALRTK